jgi:hypothetical protein
MGSCCFTPRRTQFLWWYWLLLASIVGIPMFLACWYVARHKPADEQVKLELGKGAAKIFWLSTALAAGLTFAVGWCVYQNVVTETERQYSYVPSVFNAYVLLVIAYVGSLALLSGRGKAGAGEASRALRFSGRLLLLAVLLTNTVWSVASTMELFLQMAVCLAVAQFLREFTMKPNRTTARRAGVALCLGALLFWGATKYGRVANLYLYRLVRGERPQSAEIEFQMNIHSF